jgi:trimeric autotransporter adhesin
MVLRRAVLLSLCALFALLVAGCSTSSISPAPSPINGSRYSGSVHGGQQPVVGASIQLYTVGTTADGSAATPLLTTTVTSDSTGSFTITGLYSCTSATEVYIVATGGNPGLSTANPNIALMAAVGPCSSLTLSTFISINELTTVAAVAALAPYMSSISAIGSSSNDTSSLAAAFKLANEFVNTTTGSAPGTGIPAGSTDPVAELNTLADIVSACINSTGGTAGDGSLCGQFFSLTTVSPNAAPTDTITALINLANDPTQNTSALFALTPPTPPFQPTLTSAPSSFLIQLIPPTGSSTLQVTPSSISFPDTSVGSSSQPSTVTLQNTGSTSISLNSLSLSGTNSSDFSIVNPTCGTSLNGGNSCSAKIVAKPSATGSRTASFVVTSSASSSPQSVALTVDGTAPTYSVTLTSSASFTIVGTLQDLTLSNQGNTSVNIASVIETDSGSSPYFAIAANNCSTSIAAGSSCTITVLSSNAPSITAQPVTVTGTLTVTDDAGTQTAALTSSDSYAIEVSQFPSYVPSPGIVSFPNTRVGSPQTGTTIYYTPWVSGAVAPPIPLTLGGSDPSDFTATVVNPGVAGYRSTCTEDYAYGDQCQITYSFKPTAAGPRSAKLSLDPSFGTPTGQYILLQGTGVGGSTGFRTDLSSLSLQSYLPGNIDPKSAGAAIITVTNIGIAQLSLGATFTGTAAPYLSASTTNCATLNAQSTCTVPVTFSASTVGNSSGNLTLADSTSGFSVSLPITATTSYWPAVATPSLLSFGSLTIGTTSAAQNFVIADPNGYPLGHPYSVSLQPSSNFELTQGSTCSASTTQTCTLSAAFAPQTVGAISEAATITDQTTGLQTQLALYGNGGAPTYTLSTTGIVFPASITGVASAPIAVTLTANGTQPVSVSGISITGDPNNDFTQSNNCSSVSPGSACTINVTFAPTSAGTPSAALQIASNGVNSPTSVSLSGIGSSATGSPVLQISPSTVTFPATVTGFASPTQAVTITNTASGPVTITSISVSGASGATFTIASGSNCVGMLNAGGSCTISLTATPSATTGTGSLAINSTTPDSPQSVPLSITGASSGSGGSTASLAPSSFTFTIWGANKDFTVTNTGVAPLSVGGETAGSTGGGVEHGYGVLNNTCGSDPVAAGASCTFTVYPYLLVPLWSYIAGSDNSTGQVVVSDDATTGSGQQTASIFDNESAYLLVGGSGVNGNGIANGVTFPANQVGSTQTATIQLANFSSGSPAASLTIGGANPGDFAVSALEPSVSSSPSSSCPGTGTAACTITITFTPTAVGTRTAEISLDAGGSSTGQYIYVTGTALPTGPSFTTNDSTGGALIALSIPPGGSANQTMTVTNTGSTTLNLAAIITGVNATSFTANTSQCQSVAPQATCPVLLTFSGTNISSTSSYTASLFLYDQSSTASTTVSLTGTVSSRAPTISFGEFVSIYPYVSFPNQPVNTVGQPMNFTVNGFGDPITLSLSSTDFTLTNSTICPANSQPCTLSVAFSPGTTGTRQASLVATDTLTGEQSTVILSGTATQ